MAYSSAEVHLVDSSAPVERAGEFFFGSCAYQHFVGDLILKCASIVIILMKNETVYIVNVSL